MSEDIRAKSFLPPDDYEILRFGGESVKDEEQVKGFINRIIILNGGGN